MSKRADRKLEEQQILVDQHNWRLSLALKIARHCSESGHRFYISRDESLLQKADLDEVARCFPIEALEQLSQNCTNFDFALLFAPIDCFMKCLTYGWLGRWNEETNHAEWLEIKGNASLPILARDPSWFSKSSPNETSRARKWTDIPVQEFHIGSMANPQGFKPIRNEIFEHVILTSHIQLGLLTRS